MCTKRPLFFHSVRACHCNSSGVCFSQSETEPLIANSVLRICLFDRDDEFLQDETEIDSIVSLGLYQNFVLVRTPIRQGIPDALTIFSIVVNPVQGPRITVATRLVSRFFTNESPESIEAEGSVTLRFKKQKPPDFQGRTLRDTIHSYIRRQRRRQQEATGVSKFSISIPLQLLQSHDKTDEHENFLKAANYTLLSMLFLAWILFGIYLRRQRQSRRR